MPKCDNCRAEVPEIHETSWGQSICCPACAFNPLGCRCKYGEFGVAETYQNLEPGDPELVPLDDGELEYSPYDYIDDEDDESEPDFTLDDMEWDETYPELSE